MYETDGRSVETKRKYTEFKKICERKKNTIHTQDKRNDKIL